MRTTVTLDDDVLRELRARIKYGDKSFKQVLNDTLRLAFSVSRSAPQKMKRFQVRAHRSAFRRGIDAGKLNQLLDQLDVEDRLESFQKDLSKKNKK